MASLDADSSAFSHMSSLLRASSAQPYQGPSPPSSTMDGSCSPAPAAFICPQDVHKSEPSDAASEYDNSNTSYADPSPVEDGSEPARKKRKSWGQVLPKPTTNLPPRKRAKTEEEKAQRKYERVQRNRHAAHMSRMRKQDEMETLKIVNDRLLQDNSALEDEVTRLRDELNRFRSGNTSLTTNFSHRPITPPYKAENANSNNNATSHNSPMPSLTSHSPSDQSVDMDILTTPHPTESYLTPKFPLFVDTSHSKQPVDTGLVCEHDLDASKAQDGAGVRIKDLSNGSDDVNDFTMMDENDMKINEAAMTGLQTLENFSMDQFVDFEGLATEGGANSMDFGSLGLDLGADFAWPSSFPGSTSTTDEIELSDPKTTCESSNTENSTNDAEAIPKSASFPSPAQQSSELPATSTQTLTSTAAATS